MSRSIWGLYNPSEMMDELYDLFYIAEAYLDVLEKISVGHRASGLRFRKTTR